MEEDFSFHEGNLPVEEVRSAPDSQAALLDLATAVQRIPPELRQEMEQLLRAEFREVIRWSPN